MNAMETLYTLYLHIGQADDRKWEFTWGVGEQEQYIDKEASASHETCDETCRHGALERRSSRCRRAVGVRREQHRGDSGHEATIAVDLHRRAVI